MTLPDHGHPTSALALTTLVPAGATALLVLIADPTPTVTALVVATGAVLAWWTTLVLVVRPLLAAEERSRSARTHAELALFAERAEREFRSRFERALRGTDSETAALGTGLRALAETVETAEVALLLNLPDEPRVGWRIDLVDGRLTAAVPVPGSPTCSALRDGRALVTASSNGLDACAHLRTGGPDEESSATCVPLRVGERAIGSVCITEAPGETISSETLDRIEWIVERTGQRATEHRQLREPAAIAPPDPLTGLPGPAALRPSLRDLVRSLSPFCLAVVQVDGWAHFDTDPEADAAVRAVAEVLCETVRPDDLICRLDGPTFAAVLPECSATQAVAVMERFRESLVLLLAENGPHFTCSAGVVESHRATSLDEVVDLAMTACDRAAGMGGNRVVVAEPVAPRT